MFSNIQWKRGDKNIFKHSKVWNIQILFRKRRIKNKNLKITIYMFSKNLISEKKVFVIKHFLN